MDFVNMWGSTDQTAESLIDSIENAIDTEYDSGNEADSEDDHEEGNEDEDWSKDELIIPAPREHAEEPSSPIKTEG
jgi:hypothetical protein